MTVGLTTMKWIYIKSAFITRECIKQKSNIKYIQKLEQCIKYLFNNNLQAAVLSQGVCAKCALLQQCDMPFDRDLYKLLMQTIWVWYLFFFGEGG